jgi:hypothetical protein
MRKLLIALPALALLSSCGMFFAEVEIPNITMTLANTDFPAIPVTGVMTKEIDFDLGKDISLITEKGVTFELRLTAMSLVLTATSSLADFGDVERVTVTVLTPAGQTLPEDAVLASYVKPPPPANQHPKSIAVVASSNVDLSPYLLAGSLKLRFQATSSAAGVIPAWSGDVGSEFYLKLHAEYLKAL